MTAQKPSFWQDRRVFVSGASGFLGGWLVRRLLAEGAEIVALVRDWNPKAALHKDGLDKRLNLVRGELEDARLVERALGEYEVETVFHLAAQAIVGVANRNPRSTFDSNLRGTWELLEACRRSPRVNEIVLASSDKAYGEQPRLPYTEDMPLLARHPYDVSKACAEMIGASYAHSFHLDLGITRCGNLYGGGDLNWNRIVPGTIRSIQRGKRPIIRSDGTYVRDYVYIEDAVDGNLRLAQALANNKKLRGQAFNLSYAQPQTVLQIVKRIQHRMRSRLKPSIQGQATNEIQKQYLDPTKARDVLGWTPKVGLETGLQRTIAWYRKFLGAGQ